MIRMDILDASSLISQLDRRGRGQMHGLGYLVIPNGNEPDLMGTVAADIFSPIIGSMHIRIPPRASMVMSL